MLWGIRCSIDWSNQTQGLLKDQLLRSVFKICSVPRRTPPRCLFLSYSPENQPAYSSVFPINLPISSQWPFITTSTVFESALRFKHLHTLLQMKSTHLVRDSASQRSLFHGLLFLQGKNPWAMALELGVGTMGHFSLSDTPAIGAEPLWRTSSFSSSYLASQCGSHVVDSIVRVIRSQ